jgi:hypothetical protein
MEHTFDIESASNLMAICQRITDVAYNVGEAAAGQARMRMLIKLANEYRTLLEVMNGEGTRECAEPTD